MKYISTRGQAPELDFESVVLQGLASDGGLYVPKSIPFFDANCVAAMTTMGYKDIAFTVISPYIGDSMDDDTLKQLIDKSYQKFNHSAIAPMIQLDTNQWVLELFHGPTLAFKDFALQFLGNLFDYFLEKRQQKVVIMGATSGDTGSAAIEGCYQSDWVELFILHPHKRVSEVQRRQMTTVLADNVHNIALKGNFDDCQSMVKTCFSDQSFLPEDTQLVAVNSINWARVMAQIIYYFYAATRLGSPAKSVSFSVPTGNFGDIYAGYLAKQMGLPVDQLVIATNSNDILHRCISDNDYSVKPLQASFSPSMDIMVSSNFERLLFDLYERDGEVIANLMAELKGGAMKLKPEALAIARQIFSSSCVDDDMTLMEIANQYHKTGYLLDPHSAIATTAGRAAQDNVAIAMICLATAHPAKFPDAIEKSGLTVAPELPASMADIVQREEAYQVIDNVIDEVHAYIQQRLTKS